MEFDFVCPVAFSPDGHTLASGCDDHSIKLWEVASGRRLRKLSGEPDRVNSVAFSPDGRTLVSGHPASSVELWDVASGRKLRTLEWALKRAFCVAFSPTAAPSPPGMTTAPSGSGTREWSRGALPQRAFRSREICRPLSDGRMLASGGDDPASRSGTCRAVASCARSAAIPISQICGLLPDGHTLASGSRDPSIKLWDVASGRELRTLSGDYDDAVAFSPDGRMLASGNDEPSIELWDVANGRELRMLSVHARTGIRMIVFVGRLLPGRPHARLGKSRPKHQALGCGQRPRAAHAEPAVVSTCLAFACRVRLACRLLPGRPHARLGRRAITASSSGTWPAAASSARSGDIQRLFLLSPSPPDGRTLASGSDDHSIKLWDMASGQELRTLSGHFDEVESVAFSPDGRTLASCSMDHSIKLWDVASGRERVSVIAFNGGGSLAITPQGYYDYQGSATEQNLLVRTGPGLFDVTDIGAYRETFYRPDLVRLSHTWPAAARKPAHLSEHQVGT